MAFGWLQRYMPQNVNRHIGSFSNIVKNVGNGVMSAARYITSNEGKRVAGSVLSGLGRLGVLDKNELNQGKNLLKDIQGKAGQVQKIGNTLEGAFNNDRGMKIMPVKNPKINFENNLLNNM
jgi:hypothetical protein